MSYVHYKQIINPKRWQIVREHFVEKILSISTLFYLKRELTFVLENVVISFVRFQEIIKVRVLFTGFRLFYILFRYTVCLQENYLLGPKPNNESYL